VKPLTIFGSGTKPINEGSAFRGFALVVVLQLLQAGLVMSIGDQFNSGGDAGLGRSLMVAFIGLGGAGIIQLIYVVPLYFYFKKKGRTETARGLVIAASLVILINAACWGLVVLGH
jgi:hypothetical protein